MNVEKKTIIDAVDLGYIIDPLAPVFPFSLDVYESQCAEKHSHPRGQLIYSSKGVMKVEVRDSIWLVSPRQAIWVPGMYEHQVFFLKSNHIRNLFIDPSVMKDLPDNCFALDVSAFLRELILKVTENGADYKLNSREGRIVLVLLDELARINPTRVFIPLANEIHVKKVMDELLKDPSDMRGIEEFSELACTSSRTLSRLFVKEVGMTFSDWRKQLRLMQAIEKLENGVSVSQISYDLGYNSPSAFIHMFSKTFGVTPNKYLDR